MSAPVVLLHSSGSSARQWKELAGKLGAAARAPDFYGHGTRATEIFEPATLRVEAAPIEELLEQLGRARLVGHSYGGAVAINIALRRPELVEALVLYEPMLFSLLRGDPGSQSEWFDVISTANDMKRLLASGDAQASAARFIDFWSGDGAWAAMPPSIQPAVAERMPAVIRHVDALFGDSLAASDLAQLPPILLASGARTVPAARRAMQLLQAAVPHAKCKVFDGMGHMGPVTHAADFARHVSDHLETLADATRQAAMPA